jgi:hypothetical protein
MATREIGIFALPTVLVPGERMPLHVFEERYKQLISECLDLDREFLLLYADEGGTRELGCAAHVEQVLRVVEMTRGQAYTTAMADAADEDLSAGDETEPVMELFRQIASAGGGDPEEDLTASGQPLSYAIMARVDFPAEEKQRVLELRAESSRLLAIIDLLARGLQTLAQIEQIRERAQTNGKVPHGE